MRHSLRTAALALMLLSLASAANAEGRWGARFEYPFRANAYVETVAHNVGSWELGTGVMGRWSEGEPLEVTPYGVLSHYGERSWYAIEFALPVRVAPVQLGFSIAVSIGGRFGAPQETE